MSNVTHVERKELASLMIKFCEAASKEGDPLMINRTEFHQCLTLCAINQNDVEIFDRLFTMFDKTVIMNYSPLCIFLLTFIFICFSREMMLFTTKTSLLGFLPLYLVLTKIKLTLECIYMTLRTRDIFGRRI